MKLFFKIYVFILLVLLTNILQAQQKLTPKQAIAIALENNYAIKLSNNNTAIATNNVSLGNAGFLPNITANLNDVNRVETSKVDLTTGQTREATNAPTTNINYGVGLTWRIFDGLQMFATYNGLKELQKLGDLNARLTVQNTIADVLVAYYDVVTQEKQYEAAKIALDVSALRLKNANSRYRIGKGAKLEVLAAKVDFNTDTTQILRQQDAIQTAKIRLNDLLARDPKTEFSVEDSIKIDPSLVYENLVTQTETQNPDLQAALINQRIAKFNLQQIKGTRYPVLGLTSGYNFQNSTAPPTSFALRSNVRGFNYGFTASLNIFNGFQQNRIEKNAKIQLDNAALELLRAKQTVNSTLLNSYQSYQTNIKLIGLEEKNVAVAQENLNITLEKYRLGSIVPLELREAQRNFLDANVRYTNSLYQAKLSEVGIKEIIGKITL